MSHQIRWTVEKISQRLRLIQPLVYRRRAPLPPFRYRLLAGPQEVGEIGIVADDSGWAVVEPNSYWVRRGDNFILRTRFRVPEDWDADALVALYLPLGDDAGFSHPEALAYIDGVPYAAADRHHNELRIPADWRDGADHVLALPGYAGTLPEPGTARAYAQLMMGECAVVQIDEGLRAFIITARVALGVVIDLDLNDPARGHLLNALDDAFKILDTREPFGDDFYASVPAAHAALQAGVAKAGAPLDVRIVGSGHAHIDVAWLWTLAQTRRKAGRTFYTVMRLMEEFPDYHFSQSQPQLYDYVRQDYPELFAMIKQRVAEGRWEPMGGMWVEADCNISGGESLARQFLLGRAFWREHFGEDVASPVLWLPDVFGYAWNLPQLIKLAGLEYFFTIKIGWNQYNRLPYDSFWWQGLDGTRVLTHFSTTPEADVITNKATYNAMVTPRSALGTWYNFQQKEIQQDILMSFGYGDGGGGPNREMLENLREMQTFPAVPQMRMGSVIDFFRNLERTVGDKLPTWNGELYFELHRGTYTTQSRNKRANRKSEFLLHDAEFVCVLASLLDPEYVYPAADLRRAWELVCLNQFHDIIPGSSITDVYKDSMAQYDEVETLGSVARSLALRAIAAKVGGDIIIVNPTSFSRCDVVFYPDELPAGYHLQQPNGTPLETQTVADGTLIMLCNVGGESLAPYSVMPLLLVEGQEPAFDHGNLAVTATPFLLENDGLRVELNAAGDITRIWDKGFKRDVLPPGMIANQFQAFEDRPKDWDAWDVDIFYDDRMWTAEPAISVEVVEAGPLRGTLEIRRRILNSEYVQRISLSYQSSRLDFDTTIDWQERHILLKVAFPVDILSPTATYEIQWGNVERPTHQNTSWDWARFETCAQKWVDLSEGGYGVALLNDSKYGHDVKGNVMRLSLLRAPTFPDPEADQGQHQFSYSLLPHQLTASRRSIIRGVAHHAYAINDPLLVTDGDGNVAIDYVFLTGLGWRSTIIETIKRAEDGNGIIVRLYEYQRTRGDKTLRFGFPIAAAYITNLMEDNQQELTPSGDERDQLTFYVMPFQIVTLRVIPAGQRGG